MSYDPDQHHRRSIRLKGYDYSQAGAYFVTVCVQDRGFRFGNVVDGEMRVNDAGRMVQATWEQLPQRFATLELDAFVVMPNHFHAIIVIGDTTTSGQSVGAGLVPALASCAQRPGIAQPYQGQPPGLPLRPALVSCATAPGQPDAAKPTLGSIIGAFKSIATVEYIHGVRQLHWPRFEGCLWQRNYYEHIIRSEKALNRIREYTEGNPELWDFDRENPCRKGMDEFDRWLDNHSTIRQDGGL